MEPVTKSFLGSPDTWHNAKVELDDIHDLWGGKCITLYGDGTAFVKIVDLGQSAETYRLQLDEERVPELFEALLKPIEPQTTKSFARSPQPPHPHRGPHPWQEAPPRRSAGHPARPYAHGHR